MCIPAEDQPEFLMSASTQERVSGSDFVATYHRPERTARHRSILPSWPKKQLVRFDSVGSYFGLR